MNVYYPKGTCSREIHYSVKDGIVEDIKVIGGCSGNLNGICRLIKGMPVEQVVKAFKGVDCNGRGTSCPDQIAAALEQA
ncbi:MAG: TIGR03905 family TSCPD domain-containing protein [Butyricicoccus sp.]